ncbi:hypothetical protein ACO0LO_19710 [Undibacterium sp. TJN25]|uniref:hypothetical protein n=1 Tax=Undibacterium sp. TJN25 TaxID=3413056 RepID=UPI003BF2CD55
MSVFAEILVGLITVFESVLLIVTEAFNGAVFGLSAALLVAEVSVTPASSGLLVFFAAGFASLPVTALLAAFAANFGSSFKTLFVLALGASFAASFATAAPAFSAPFFTTLGALTSFATSFFRGAGLVLAAACTAGFAVCLLAAIALAAGFTAGLDAAAMADTLPVVFFVAGVVRVFAGFFIALAIESNQPALRPHCRS